MKTHLSLPSPKAPLEYWDKREKSKSKIENGERNNNSKNLKTRKQINVIEDNAKK